MSDVTLSRPATTDELSAFVLLADGCLTDFFRGAERLSSLQLDSLTRVTAATALTPLSLEVDRAYLTAVASGRWTSTHRSLTCQLQQTARLTAADLVRWGRRRRLAHALSAAGMVVLADADPAAPLPDVLCTRLAAPWVAATGRWPGAL